MPSPTRQGWKMNCRGVNLSTPIDQLQAGDYPYLSNARVVQQGSIEARPGQQVVSGPHAGAVHSIRRLNNLIAGEANPYQIFAGVDTALFAGADTLSLIDTGYSGNPLSMVRFRPENSPEAWMYIADQNKMVKVNTDLTVRNVGIAPPLHEPYAETYYPHLPEQIEIWSFGDPFWNTTGPVSGITVVDRVPPGVVAVHLIYDDVIDTNGFCCLNPNDGDSSWKQPGFRITLNDGVNQVTVPIQEVHNAIPSTTIAGIAYDSGNTGLCTIVLATQAQGVTRNSLLQLNNLEVVRVLSSVVGPDGLCSVRCSTQITHAANESVNGMISVRVSTGIQFAENPPGGIPITGKATQFTVTPSGDTATSGLIWRPNVLDCSALVGRPIQPDDYMHISLKFDNPANLLYGRVLLNLDPAFTDFTHNYYQKEFRPSDFQAVGTGASSILATQTAIQNAYVEGSGIPYVSGDIYTAPNLTPGSNLTETETPQSAQLGTGNNVWTELLFRISDLQRIGSDITLGLADVNAIGIEVVAQNGPITCTVTSWWIGGTFGADVDSGSPTGIKYRYRYRDSRTGAKSIPGPATRFDLFPLRQDVVLLAAASPDPQVDSIDFERLDPNLQTSDGPPIWKYVG